MMKIVAALCLCVAVLSTGGAALDCDAHMQSGHDCVVGCAQSTGCGTYTRPLTYPDFQPCYDQCGVITNPFPNESCHSDAAFNTCADACRPDYRDTQSCVSEKCTCVGNCLNVPWYWRWFWNRECKSFVGGLIECDCNCSGTCCKC